MYLLIGLVPVFNGVVFLVAGTYLIPSFFKLGNKENDTIKLWPRGDNKENEANS